MSMARRLGILIAFALLALLILVPSEVSDTHAGTTGPPNDDFADATVISELPFSDGPVSMENATVEDGEARSTCGSGRDGTVWYRLTLEEDALLVADTAGSTVTAVLAVWTEQEGQLVQVACAGSGPSRVAFHASAGRAYYVQVGMFFNELPLTLALQFEEGAAVVNDDFTDATGIASLPFSGLADTRGATKEQEEPGACIGGKFAVAPDATVWYAYIPTEDALVVADTSGSDFDTVLNVWTQGVFALNLVACDVGSRAEPPQPARVAFEARAGQVYYLQVGGVPFQKPSGNLVFGLRVGVPPENDDFADASDITLPFSNSIDTISATTELSEPAPVCANRGIVSTIWYRISAEEDSLIFVDSTSDDLNFVFGVYQGDTLAELAPVLCAGPTSPDSKLAFRAFPGEAYYLQVGGSSRKRSPVFVSGDLVGEDQSPEEDGKVASVGNGGDVLLTIRSRDVPPCPPPAFILEDRVDDVTVWFAPREPGRQHDILSIGSSSTADELCIQVEFAGSVAPPDTGSDHALFGTVTIDTDEDEHSGTGLYLCGSTGRLGVEAEINLRGGFGLLAPIAVFIGEPGQVASEGQFAIALYEGNSFSLVIPLEAIGGDDALRFSLSVRDDIIRGSDCAPDSGFYQSPPPAVGDANCDRLIDARDAVMILQFFASLSESLLCEYVADANGNGTVGSIDAALILQLDAGLIDVLPGAR